MSLCLSDKHAIAASLQFLFAFHMPLNLLVKACVNLLSASGLIMLKLLKPFKGYDGPSSMASIQGSPR